MIDIIAVLFEQHIAVFCCFALGECGVNARNCSLHSVFVNICGPVNERFHHFRLWHYRHVAALDE